MKKTFITAMLAHGSGLLLAFGFFCNFIAGITR